jgi:hypothetical protein
MPDRRYEVRVTGRLSDVAQAALAAADVADVAAETVISGLVRHDQGLHQSSWRRSRSSVCASCPSSC